MLDQLYEASDLPMAVGQQSIPLPAVAAGPRTGCRKSSAGSGWYQASFPSLSVPSGRRSRHPGSLTPCDGRGGTTTVGTAAIMTTAAVVPGASLTHPWPGTPATPNPVAGVYSASPIAAPSSPLKLAAITGAITKPRLDADGLAGQVPPSLAAPYLYVPSQPSPTSPSYQQPVSSQSSQQGGSVQIAVSTTAWISPQEQGGDCDLDASGDGGWAAWKVDARTRNRVAQTDLDFSSSHGVLRPAAGSAGRVTAGYVLDEAASGDVRDRGQSVTIALPGPPPAPAVAPSPVDTSLPTLGDTGPVVILRGQAAPFAGKMIVAS